MNGIKTILKRIKPYWKQLALFTLFSILSVIFALFSFTMVIPFLRVLFSPNELVLEPVKMTFSSKSVMHNFFYLISKIIVSYGTLKALLVVCLSVVFATFFKATFIFLSRHFNIFIKNGVVKDVNADIYKKILELPLSSLSEEKKGDIMARFSSDVAEIRITVVNFMTMLIRDPVTIIVFLFYLFFANWKLTVIILISIPIVALLIGRIGKSLKKKSLKAQQTFGKLLSNIEEVLSGLRIIKVFNVEKHTYNNFKKLNLLFFKQSNSVERKKALSSPLSEFMGTVVIISIMFLGGFFILKTDSSMSSEEFIAYLIVFSQILSPAKSISNSYFSLQKGLASIQRVEEILEIKNNITEKESALPITNFAKKIEFRNVSFRYAEKYVLKNINLTIEKGTTVALVGESGSGKSTLVDLLPRLYDIEEGEILIDGTNIKDLKIKDLRNLMGNVNQESILFNDTIANNIAFGETDYEQSKLEEAAKIANAHNFILEKPLKYEENIGDRGAKLSGGQRQRISIARAVLKNPPIMILDEATSALDTESEKAVQEALINLMKNRTSIVIAHRLSTVRNAHKICVLSEGQIIETGNHDKLIEKNGAYKKLCDLQMV